MQGIGFHFAPLGSFRNVRLTMNGSAKYCGSSIRDVVINQTCITHEGKPYGAQMSALIGEAVA